MSKKIEIKLFSGKDTETVEYKVNRWISKSSDAYIIHSINVCGKGDEIIVCVYYTWEIGSYRERY